MSQSHSVTTDWSRFIISIVLIGLFCQLTKINGVSPPNIDKLLRFCYEEANCDESTWDGVCNTGIRQSPINIRLILFKPYFAIPTRFFLNRAYGTESVQRFYGHNNGHTLQFDLDPGADSMTSDLEISGGNLGNAYRFAQLHFHWAQNDNQGSEHRINGQSYPLELHLVHYKSTYASLNDALSEANNDREAVAVMAVFFVISNLENTALNPIISAAQSLQNPEDDPTEFTMSLRISDLYPRRLEFARYLGSLTTPTCDEKVIWTVFLRPLRISRTQLQAFRTSINEEGNSEFNFRMLQPLNGRRVSFYRAKLSRRTQPITRYVSGFSLLRTFFRMMFDQMLKYFKTRQFPLPNSKFLSRN